MSNSCRVTRSEAKVIETTIILGNKVESTGGIAQEISIVELMAHGMPVALSIFLGGGCVVGEVSATGRLYHKQERVLLELLEEILR